eukprot:2523336-Pleurochrysis_carterae.AAC.3
MSLAQTPVRLLMSSTSRRLDCAKAWSRLSSARALRRAAASSRSSLRVPRSERSWRSRASCRRRRRRRRSACSSRSCAARAAAWATAPASS